MKRRSLVMLYIGALSLVAGAAIAARSTALRRSESPIPSVESSDARGAKALFAYLTETGARPLVLRAPLTEVPPDAKVIVSVSPRVRPFTHSEWKAIQHWVREGNTFVYGTDRERKGVIEEALALEAAEQPNLDNPFERGEEPKDPSGASAIPWLPSTLFAGVQRLRVASSTGVDSTDRSALPVAGFGATPSILTFPEGDGEIVALADAALAENRRVGLEDNLVFWLNIAARGRVAFDEHHARDADSQSQNLFAAIGPTVLQLLLGAGVLAWAVGRRLGEIRPLARTRRRSQAEYVRQLAQLYAAARVEPDLCTELYRSFRRLLLDRLGISTSLDDLDVAQRLKQRSEAMGERYLGLVARVRNPDGAATPQAFARLSKDFALLERDLGCEPT